MLGDETNRPPKDGQFFLYGGLALSAESIHDVHREVQELREKHGLADDADLKFSNHAGVSPDVYKAIKVELLQMLVARDVSFLATGVLQQILAGQSDETAMSWAINSITATFHRFLEAKESYGAVFIDRVGSAEVNRTMADMSRSFQLGLKYPDGYKSVNDRIVMFGMTSNNSSHLSSCADIVLGSFRYCVNAAIRQKGKGRDIAAEIMPLVDKLFWRVRPDGLKYDPSGLQLLPLGPKYYRQEYEDLRSNLQSFSKGEAT